MPTTKEPMPFQYKFLCVWPFTTLFTYAIIGSIKSYDAWGIKFVSVFVGFCLSIAVTIGLDIAEMYMEDKDA